MMIDRNQQWWISIATANNHQKYFLARSIKSKKYVRNERYGFTDLFDYIVIELDDEKIETGKSVIFDGKNPWVSG